jgi:hypothetical protein
LTVTEASDAFTGVGAVALSTSFNRTEDGDILSGSIGSEGSVSLSVFEASDIVVGSVGVEIRASAAISISDVLDANVGFAGFSAALSITEDDDFLSDAMVNAIKYRSMTCSYEQNRYNMVLLGPSETEYCIPKAGTIAVDGKLYSLVPTQRR